MESKVARAGRTEHDTPNVRGTRIEGRASPFYAKFSNLHSTGEKSMAGRTESVPNVA